MSIPITKVRGFERIGFISRIVFTWATTSPAITSGRGLQLCMCFFHYNDFHWGLKKLLSFKSIKCTLYMFSVNIKGAIYICMNDHFRSFYLVRNHTTPIPVKIRIIFVTVSWDWVIVQKARLTGIVLQGR